MGLVFNVCNNDNRTIQIIISERELDSAHCDKKFDQFR